MFVDLVFSEVNWVFVFGFFVRVNELRSRSTKDNETHAWKKYGFSRAVHSIKSVLEISNSYKPE